MKHEATRNCLLRCALFKETPVSLLFPPHLRAALRVDFALIGGNMKLTTIERKDSSKSEVKRLRREGYIPAVLYVRGNAGLNVAVDRNEFSAALRHLKPGYLPTTVFTLVDQNGHQRRVIIKEIQYAVTTYQVIHLDLEELVQDHPINVKVPVECVGEAECPGVKAGGVLRRILMHVRIRCLPKDLPASFALDVSSLGLKQSKRVKDLQIPETIRPLAALDDVVAVVVKR